MRSLLLIGGVLLLPPTAFAQSSSASTEITITGEAKPACRLSAGVANGGVNASYSNNTVAITQLVDEATSKVQASSISIRFAEAMCNYPTTVTLTSKSGGLVTAQPVQVNGQGSFLTTVPYTATVNWGGTSLVLDTAQAQAGIPVSIGTGATNAELNLTIQTKPSALPAVAGSFVDYVWLTIGSKM